MQQRKIFFGRTGSLSPPPAAHGTLGDHYLAALRARQAWRAGEYAPSPDQCQAMVGWAFNWTKRQGHLRAVPNILRLDPLTRPDAPPRGRLAAAICINLRHPYRRHPHARRCSLTCSAGAWRSRRSWQEARDSAPRICHTACKQSQRRQPSIQATPENQNSSDRAGSWLHRGSDGKTHHYVRGRRGNV